MELNWIKKTRGGSVASTTDVNFSFSKHNDKTSVVTRFSPNTASIKFHGADAVIFAISGNRLYFKPDDIRYGFKLSGENGKAKSFKTANQELVDFVHKNSHIMSSDLKYDATQELYYVDASDRQLSWKENR